MPELTLGQIHVRIKEIDSALFQAQTAQTSLTDEQYRALAVEVQELMRILSEALAKSSGKSVEDCYAERQTVRNADWLVMTTKRHMETFPEPIPEHDAIIASAFDQTNKKSNEQIAVELNKVYGYMFVNHQPKTEPAPTPPPTKKTFLRRLLKH